MELKQQKSKATFKQLDGVLRTLDPDTGERVSLSHKCTELDKEMPSLLGVSKPILEHVIFCHQEDSSWPLLEAATLKKRFDEIFDSTRYTKAIEIFRKTEKEFLGKVKDLKAELAAFGSHKHAAEGFRKDLEQQNEQLNELDELKDQNSKKLQKLERELQAVNEILQQVGKVDELIMERQAQLDQELTRGETLQRSLDEDLTEKHSLVELRSLVRDFDQKMQSQVEQLEELQSQEKRLKESIQALLDDERKLTSQMGKFAAEREAQEKRMRERFSIMEKLDQSYELSLSTQLSQQSLSQRQNSFLSASQTVQGDESVISSVSAEDMKRFFEALDKKREELQQDINEQKRRFQTEEDNIQSALTELGGRLKAVDNGTLLVGFVVTFDLIVLGCSLQVNLSLISFACLRCSYRPLQADGGETEAGERAQRIGKGIRRPLSSP
jgi:DNA repair protein RAD50